MKRARRNFTAALLMILLLVACSDQDLVTLSKALNDSAKGISVFQTTVIQANTDKLLSDQTTKKLLEATVKVNEAGQQGVQMTRALSKLSPQDRSNVLQVLRPVIDQVNSILNTDIVTIPDPKTRDTIRAALFIVQTALNTANIALTAH